MQNQAPRNPRTVFAAALATRMSPEGNERWPSTTRKSRIEEMTGDQSTKVERAAAARSPPHRQTHGIRAKIHRKSGFGPTKYMGLRGTTHRSKEDEIK